MELIRETEPQIQPNLPLGKPRIHATKLLGVDAIQVMRAGGEHLKRDSKASEVLGELREQYARTL